MKKIYLLSMAISAITVITAYSQSKPISIHGKIVDQSTGSALPGVSIQVKGKNTGAVSDSLGSFRLNVPALPANLILSNISYEEKEVIVSEANITIQLKPVTSELAPVIVGWKVPVRMLDAAFSAERMGLKHIRNLPTTSPYEGTAYLKGVDVTTSGLLFKTPSTRGFNGSGSSRVNQIVDGMDNQAPGLNFFVGNFTGPSDLDVESIELLPGASSALYGPGGMNGTIIINSKSPFTHPGLSVHVRQGVMHVDNRQRDISPYHDFSFRWAKNINNRFAFKIGAQYTGAKDWLANDSSNYLRGGTSGKLIPGTRMTDPNYDGVNVYGDETSVDLRQFIGAIALSYPPGSPQQQAILQIYNSMQNPTPVSRTGYSEKDLIDPNTFNAKLNGALHYKINPKLEAILMGNWATGNTVYTDDNRYALKGIKIGQYKFELKHKNWFLRSFTTQEDAGEAYSATVATQMFNEAWKRSYDPANPSSSWYLQYAGAYIQAIGLGASNIVAHNNARAYADRDRPQPGSPIFKELFEKVRKTPIPNGGLFKEKSQLWMTEGQYKIGDANKNAEVIAGMNYKKYLLDSDGTLFIDTLQKIGINEFGGYMQVTRKLFKGNVTLTGSGRFDKNENFKLQFTPRAAVLISVKKDHKIRFSYQTAYRFPSNLSQWIRLNVGGDYMLLGGLPWVMDYMQADKDPVYQVDQNGIPSASKYEYKEFKPETMRSFELGYKALINERLLIDAYGYMGKYEDFIGRIGLIQPATGEVYSIVVNSTNKVKTHGFGVGMNYDLKKNYSVFFNAYSDVITDVPAGFKSYFNAPKYRWNAGIANSGLGKKERVMFNILARWQEGFNWEGELANGPLPSFISFDAQVSYKFQRTKTLVRLGGTNIFNHYYKNAYANPMIGGLYYASFIYNLQ